MFIELLKIITKIEVSKGIVQQTVFKKEKNRGLF